MEFKNLAYSKIDIEFDKDLFIREYDNIIMPNSRQVRNGEGSMELTRKLNSIWGMVPDNEYDTIDSWTQAGDASTYRPLIKGRPAWDHEQLLRLVLKDDDHPLIVRQAELGGVGLRNETLGRDFVVKDQYKDLEIVKWVYNLPLTKINSIQCVSLAENSFSTIHRDGKGMLSKAPSAGVNKVFNSGFVVICINITSGEVPLYWSLDHDVRTPILANDPVYLINDYFLHGVPVCKSKRRQIRVTGKPNSELWNLLDQKSMIVLDDNYKYASVENYYRY